MKHFKLTSQANPPAISEPERLRALRRYHILDTEPEQAFNDLAQLAAFVCSTPMAMVSLIDERRQWFKARTGVDVAQIPREHAFCQYAMRAEDVYEIPDTAADPRFDHNPLVTGSPYIRFYSGAPLLTPEGQCVGTLCALDVVPRQLSPDQREALRVLARQVMALLELRRLRIGRPDEPRRPAASGRAASAADARAAATSRPEIFVKQEQRLVRVATADLQHVEAQGDYVNLHTTRDRLTVYGTMKELEAKLPGHDFARVHRKYIVRLDRVLAIEADALVLDAGAPRAPVRVPIGNSYKAALLGRLNLV